MRFNVVIRYMGIVLLMNALFLLISAGVGLTAGVDTGFYPLLLSALLTAVLGAFPLIFVESERTITSKEGYLIVVGAWIASCFMGMMPYLLWGGEFSVDKAWFESVSGFTATGATILDNIEALPRSLLFWRSTTHWLGGIGVVMFVMIILPAMGQARLALSNAQISPLAKENFRYKVQKIVLILLVVYLGLTVLQTICLRLAGMGWFDAVNHSFSTIATGGFSTKNESIGYFRSPVIESITFIFMIMGGMHFGLVYATVAGRRNNFLRSEVTRFYLGYIAAAAVVIALFLWRTGVYGNFGESLRYGGFQLVSALTTTGFSTADSNVWPPVVILLLLFSGLVAACAGSTAGGIKIDRFLLAGKSILAQIQRMRHPSAIVRVKMNGVAVPENAVQMVNVFILAFLVIVFVGAVLFAAMGLDLMTAFSLSLSSMSNIGPGFGQIGATETFASLSVPVKLLASVLMLLGRLEIFGLIQIFIFKLWR